MGYNEGMKKQLYFCLISSLALCSCGTDMRRWDKLILPFKAKDVLRVNISEKINVTSDPIKQYQVHSTNPEVIESVYHTVTHTPVIPKSRVEKPDSKDFIAVYFETSDGIYDVESYSWWSGSYLFYNDKFYYYAVYFSPLDELENKKLQDKYEKIEIG